MTFLVDPNRLLAAGVIAALALMVLATSTPVPPESAVTQVAGQTPRTAKPCDPQACLSAAPDRPRVGFGSGGSQAGEPVLSHDRSLRWVAGEPR